ncbi:hypothetical protein [Chromobacterium sp. CV08]|uniref:hypothetical protein n=1 Tax=Chromobacterium sp. CV08 TaxID=3133274 RepID=UPI003DAA16A7
MGKNLLCLLALLPCLAVAEPSITQTAGQTMYARTSLLQAALRGGWRYPLGTHRPGGTLHPSGAIHCTRSPRHPLDPLGVLHPRPTTCHHG